MPSRKYKFLKKSDQAEFGIDDGETKKTINLRQKKKKERLFW
jgi:hypothetical protein